MAVMISPFTAWKLSKYGVFSGPYFPVFGLNTCIWTEYGDLSETYQKGELFNEHEEFCRSFNHINLMILSKLKTIIDKSTSEKKKQ